MAPEKIEITDPHTQLFTAEQLREKCLWMGTVYMMLLEILACSWASDMIMLYNHISPLWTMSLCVYHFKRLKKTVAKGTKIQHKVKTDESNRTEYKAPMWEKGNVDIEIKWQMSHAAFIKHENIRLH